MDIRLDGKVALVTGASRGIGLATARSLAESGASVMMASRKQESLDEAAGSLPEAAAMRVATCAAHVGKPEALAELAEQTVERFGAIDILVNNAATSVYMGRTIDTDLPAFDKTMEINFRAQFAATQTVYRVWMQEHGGCVINMASVGGLIAEPAIGIYNAAKAALIHLTRTLSVELAPDVRVNALAPGLVKTHLARALWEPAEDAIAATMPMKRLGEPDDIAAMATFLASDQASWITGQTFVIDGGLSAATRT